MLVNTWMGRRLTRLAQFVKVENDADAVQLLTDCMANGLEVQLEYADSGWRTVVPYGWHSSQAGNLLVMCYKNGSEVRSYRLDRVQQLYVDSTLFGTEPQPVIDLRLDGLLDNQPKFEDFQIPDLPNVDQILALSEGEDGEPAPFDEGLETLEEFRYEPAPMVDDLEGVGAEDADELGVNSVDDSADLDVDDEAVDGDEVDEDEDVLDEDEQGADDDAEQGDEGLDDAGEQGVGEPGDGQDVPPLRS